MVKTADAPPLTREVICELGLEIQSLRIEPTLLPIDKGKFVAIDVNSGEFEIDEDDFKATRRLRDRIPSAEVYLGCIGYETAYRFGTSI